MFRDREYLSSLIKTALPIAIQNFISTSLNAVGVLLIGQLGETSVAAVGLGNQIFFLLSLIVFGITSGSAIFTAQYWGLRDIPAIRRVVGVCLLLALSVSAAFTVIALALPEQALAIYTSDPEVIRLGGQYLRLAGFSYLSVAFTYTFANLLRSTGQVRIPMAVTVVALGLGTALNYTLIFGLFGLPAMGVRGAGLGTSIARFLEAVALVFLVYRLRTPLAARLAEMRAASRAFLKRYFITILPVVFNETLWSFGITTYNLIYARISTESIAAVNISSTIESMALVAFIGISNASAILVGNQIGAGREDQAFTYARRGLLLVIGGTMLMGVGIAAGSSALLTLYNISEQSAMYARNILLVMSIILWIKATNMYIIVGVLRAGGDTRFSLFMDTFTLWVLGLPMAYLGAFVLHLPVYWVVVMAASDEIAKMTIGLLRFRSRRWINNLAHTAAI